MAFTVLACSCTSLLVHLLLQRFQESGPVLRRPAPVPLNFKKIRTREEKYAFRPKDGQQLGQNYVCRLVDVTQKEPSCTTDMSKKMSNTCRSTVNPMKKGK